MRPVEQLFELRFQLPDLAMVHGDLLQDFCVLQLGFQDFLLIALAYAIPRFDDLLNVFQQLVISFQD